MRGFGIMPLIKRESRISVMIAVETWACSFRDRAKTVSGFLFVFCAAFGLSAHVIENDALRIEFGSPGEGYAINIITV